MSSIINELDLVFATVSFCDNYVICKIAEGLTIGNDEVRELHETYRLYYGNKRYGYIFDRTTDFTINPISYMQCPYYPDVTAFAIVAPNNRTKQTVEFEQQFSKMPLRTFDSLDEATAWMEDFNSKLDL